MRNKIMKKLLGFSISSWVTAIISFAILMVSTHLYDSENLGKINFFISVSTILTSVLNLALDQGYLRFFPENDSEVNKRMITSNMVLSFVVCSILAIGALPLTNRISTWLFGEEYELAIPLLLIGVMGLIVLRALALPWRAKGKVLPYTLLAIVFSACMKGAYIISCPFGTSWSIAFVGYVGTIALAAIIALIFNRKELAIPKFNRDGVLYKEELIFSLPLIPAMLMSNLNNSVPQFVIRSVSGFSAVAIYSAAVTLGSAINIIQTGFNTFWAPFVYENYKDKQEQIKKIHVLVVEVMVSFSILFILFQDVIFVFFKREYSAATQFLPFLVLTPLTYTIGETTQVGIAISKRSYLNILIYGAAMCVNIGLSILLVTCFGVVGAGVAVGLTAVITLALKTYLGNRFYQSVESVRPMVFGIAMYVLATVLNLILYEHGIAKYATLLAVFLIYVFSSGLLKKIIVKVKENPHEYY